MFRIRGGKGKDNPQTLVYCVYKRNEMCSFFEKWGFRDIRRVVKKGGTVPYMNSYSWKFTSGLYGPVTFWHCLYLVGNSKG
jgi:hypothetical protein